MIQELSFVIIKNDEFKRYTERQLIFYFLIPAKSFKVCQSLVGHSFSLRYFTTTYPACVMKPQQNESQNPAVKTVMEYTEVPQHIAFNLNQP